MKGIFKRLHLKLLFTFYRSHLLADTVITLLCLSTLYKWGLVSFQGIFWLKIISYGVIYYFMDALYKNQYYYYLNLGLSKSALWTVTLSIDFAVFILLIILTCYIR
ncbi:hypothetical protein [Arachidicoccus terrestris]|uniref:hypothetical protein n=1 Tax=Arachidicoccus terrestris TaxID=2875539 RepID=UPI001CC5F1F3|nr:hypothetical protein [Arachidicoccus terrestris]UAY55296.1 hypothetical protein K9M52_18115 [Arachidicoccus terrestris]